MKNKQDKISLSFFKSHTTEIIKNISDTKNPITITYRGKPKVILQDINEYKKMRDAQMLLMILSLSSKNIGKRKAKTINETFNEIRKEIR